jgi:hypothetical protein
MPPQITTPEMEIAIANHFGFRKNLIVPNVKWGLLLNGKPMHECDLLILTKSRYLWEVEIKVSKADLIADKKKAHGHINSNVKRLYFALPHYIEDYIEHIPDRAGVILVNKPRTRLSCKVVRPAKNEKGYQLSDKEVLKMAMLGAMRIWNLKQKLKDRVA